MGASMRYLSQRYAMPYKECKGLLTDIGTEELAHLEIVATIVHQLTRNLTPEQVVESGFGPYYIDHTTGIWPQSAGGIPFNACEFQSKGDPITDLMEDMAAEQKARSTYDNILRVVKDPDVCDPIRYLREREVVHFQRFGEAKREVSSKCPGSEKPTTKLFPTANYKNKRCMILSRPQGDAEQSVTPLFQLTTEQLGQAVLQAVDFKSLRLFLYHKVRPGKGAVLNGWKSYLRGCLPYQQRILEVP